MPSVQVKDFPQPLYDELKAYAEMKHRSMAQQLIVAAEQMLHGVAKPEAHECAITSALDSEGQAKEERIARRQALFSRMDASIAQAKGRGAWEDGGPDSAMLVRADRESPDRHGGGPGCEAFACDE